MLSSQLDCRLPRATPGFYQNLQLKSPHKDSPFLHWSSSTSHLPGQLSSWNCPYFVTFSSAVRERLSCRTLVPDCKEEQICSLFFPRSKKIVEQLLEFHWRYRYCLAIFPESGISVGANARPPRVATEIRDSDNGSSLCEWWMIEVLFKLINLFLSQQEETKASLRPGVT